MALKTMPESECNLVLLEAFKYRVFFDLYFPAFGLNMAKSGPEKTPYLDIFDAVCPYEYNKDNQ